MRITVVILSMLSLIACTTAPKQKEYGVTYQNKAQAAYHWELMAREIATKTKISLKDRPNPIIFHEYSDLGHSLPETDEQKEEKISVDEILMVSSKGEGPVFIDDKDKSMFGKAMRTFLRTELEKENIEISLSEKNAYKLDWSCQKIHHNAPRNDRPGLIELIFISFPKAILFGGDTDGGRPHCEILLTFKLHNNGEYIMRKSKLLYVCDEDVAQYQSVPDVQNKNGHSKLAKEVSYDVTSN